MPAMKHSSVAIIIVNWNGLEHLKLSLPSLEQLDYQLIKTYIVDNGSTDGSIAYIKKNYPKVVLIEAGQNLGFTGGNNVGMKAALAAQFEYLMLLNNDTKVSPDLVNQLVTFMNTDQHIGIAQPKLLLLDHPDRIDSCGSWLTRTGFLLHYGCEEKDQSAYNKIQPMFTVKGAAMIMRRTMLEQVGLLDNDFFAYFEETDLCWRAWLAGWQVYYAPVSTVYHKIGGSTKKIGSSVINYHSYKNRLMSMIKNLAWLNGLWMIPLHIVLMLGFSIIYFILLRGRSGWSIYRAIGWNIVHLPANLAKRGQIQSARVIADAELFKTIMRPIDWPESLSFAARFFIQRKKSDLVAEGKWRERR